MDWLDYREKLGIGFNDTQKLNHFITLIFNTLNSLRQSSSEEFLTTEEYWAFCNTVGINVDFRLLGSYQGKDRYLHFVSILERHISYLEEFLAYYVAFINSLDKNRISEFKREDYKDILVSKLAAAHIFVEILCEDEQYFVFPQGAKELDDALISEPLDWLSAYPNARKAYTTALKQYSDGTYNRDVADNLRKALETFLQEFLKNSKNLETNKNEICKYLGAQNIDPGVSGLFQPLINAYKNYNDENVKHNDKVDKKLLEFLLYQTGVLIRMVLVVAQEENGGVPDAD